VSVKEAEKRPSPGLTAAFLLWSSFCRITAACLGQHNAARTTAGLQLFGTVVQLLHQSISGCNQYDCILHLLVQQAGA
jgi:hypothetical protein